MLAERSDTRPGTEADGVMGAARRRWGGARPLTARWTGAEFELDAGAQKAGPKAAGRPAINSRMRVGASRSLASVIIYLTR